MCFLAFTFISAILFQPNWFYETFWIKADFYIPIPFPMLFVAFLFVYASIATTLVEIGIKFVKKYA